MYVCIYVCIHVYALFSGGEKKKAFTMCACTKCLCVEEKCPLEKGGRESSRGPKSDVGVMMSSLFDPFPNEACVHVCARACAVPVCVCVCVCAAFYRICDGR